MWEATHSHQIIESFEEKLGRQIYNAKASQIDHVSAEKCLLLRRFRGSEGINKNRLSNSQTANNLIGFILPEQRREQWDGMKNKSHGPMRRTKQIFIFIPYFMYTPENNWISLEQWSQEGGLNFKKAANAWPVQARPLSRRFMPRLITMTIAVYLSGL